MTSEYNDEQGARGERHAPYTRWCGAPKIGSGVAASPLLLPIGAMFQASSLVRKSMLTSLRVFFPARPALCPRPAERTAQRTGASVGTRKLCHRVFGTRDASLVYGSDPTRRRSRQIDACEMLMGGDPYQGGLPCHGTRRDLDQQLGRTRARDWAGSTGRAGRSNDG